jgi:hypothetical protein
LQISFESVKAVLHSSIFAKITMLLTVLFSVRCLIFFIVSGCEGGRGRGWWGRRVGERREGREKARGCNGNQQTRRFFFDRFPLMANLTMHDAIRKRNESNPFAKRLIGLNKLKAAHVCMGGGIINSNFY